MSKFIDWNPWETEKIFCFPHNLETLWLQFVRLDRALEREIPLLFTLTLYLKPLVRKISKFRIDKWNVARKEATNMYFLPVKVSGKFKPKFSELVSLWSRQVKWSQSVPLSWPKVAKD